MEPSNVEVAAWIGLSITSSTCLILLMKKVKQHVSCQYTMTLSTFHFLTTWMVLEILALCKRIKRFTQVPFFKRLTLAFLVMTSIVSMNFNLAANSIGFYQMSKLCCIPYMIVRNIAIKHQKYTARELASLTVLLIGVATFSVSDVEFNLLGAIYAVIAVVTTAHNQLMTGELQKEYALNGPELQLAMIPEEFVLGVIAATAMENIGEDSFANAKFTVSDILLMLATCVFAAGVNVATFGLIGKTSSITYQVVGHAKTVLLLVFGYIMFPSQWDSTFQMVRAVTGIIVALIGVFWYSKVRLDLQRQPRSDEQTPFLRKL